MKAPVLLATLMLLAGCTTQSPEGPGDVEPPVVQVPTTPIAFDFKTHCVGENGEILPDAEAPDGAGFSCDNESHTCSFAGGARDDLVFLRTILPHGPSGYESGTEHHQIVDRFFICVIVDPDADGYRYALVYYENSLKAGDNCGGVDGDCSLHSPRPDVHLWMPDQGASTFVDFSPDPGILLGSSECGSLRLTVAGTGAEIPVCSEHGIKLARELVTGLEANYYMDLVGSRRAVEKSGYAVAVQFEAGENVTMTVDQSNGFYHSMRHAGHHTHTYRSNYEILLVGDTDIEENLP